LYVSVFSSRRLGSYTHLQKKNQKTTPKKFHPEGPVSYTRNRVYETRNRVYETHEFVTKHEKKTHTHIHVCVCVCVCVCTYIYI
jgi:hypothetical protein